MVECLARLVVAALAIGLLAAPQAALAAQPSGSVRGTVRIAWQEELRYETVMRRSGQVTYTVSGRLGGPSDARRWTPGAIPPWANIVSRGHGFFLRSVVSVDRYSQSAETKCSNGAVARMTTEITGLAQPHALLTLEEPELNLVRRTAAVDVELAWAVNRDGVYRLGQAIFSTGEARTHTSGAMCTAADEQGGTAPAAIDPRSGTAPVADLLDFDLSAAVIDGIESFRGRTTPDGGFTLSTSQPLQPEVRDPGTESRSGTITIDLRFGGPPRSQGAFCVLPSDRALARTRSLGAARALLRRHGFPRVPLGAARASATPAGRYFLDWSSSRAPCGQLGTRSGPVLHRSRGIVR